MCVSRSPVFRAIAMVIALLTAPVAADAAQLRDIEVSQDGDKISILIALSAQPTGASAKISSTGLEIELSSVDIPAFTAEPADGRIVSKVVAVPNGRGGATLKLHTVDLSSASTTLYRKAVLIDARLERGRPTDAATVTPVPERAAPPLKLTTSTPATPAATPPAILVAADLETADCRRAVTAIEADPWDLDHLGNSGLCQIADGDTVKGRAQLEQLAAFNPEDWRAAFGIAEIARREDDAEAALNGYGRALDLIEAAAVKASIRARRDAFYPPSNGNGAAD